MYQRRQKNDRAIGPQCRTQEARGVDPGFHGVFSTPAREPDRPARRTRSVEPRAGARPSRKAASRLSGRHVPARRQCHRPARGWKLDSAAQLEAQHRRHDRYARGLGAGSTIPQVHATEREPNQVGGPADATPDPAHQKREEPGHARRRVVVASGLCDPSDLRPGERRDHRFGKLACQREITQLDDYVTDARLLAASQ